MVARFTWR